MKYTCFIYSLLISFLSISTLQAQEQGVETRKDSTSKVDEKGKKPKKEIKGPRFLALDIHRRFGKVKRLRFYRGNKFTFKLKGSNERFQTQIEHVGKTHLGILGGSIPLDNIDKIIVRNPSWFIHSGAALFPIVGIGYFALDMINPALDDNPGSEPFTVHREAVIISGTLLLTGIIFKFLKKRVFKINKRRILRPMIKF